jgi:hypothetical protein
METIFAHLRAAVTDPPVEATYSQDVGHAIAALATLAVLVLVIYLVVRATYLILKLFTQAAFSITAVVMMTVVLIGWLNR